MMEKQKIEKAVFAAIEQVNKLLPRNLRLDKNLDEKIVARDSKLDSLGLVNLLVALEQQIESETGKKIILTEESNYEEDTFGTIESLIDHIFGKLSNKQDG